MSPLPPFYRFTFCVFEPLTALAGALYALVTPTAYFDNIVSSPITETLGGLVTGGGHRGRIVTNELGSCSCPSCPPSAL